MRTSRLVGEQRKGTDAVRMGFRGRKAADAMLAASLLICCVLLASCGNTGGRARVNSAPTALPTTTYLPPIVATATATKTPSPTPTKAPVYGPPPTPPPGPAPIGGVPRVSGQLILVSLAQQWLWAYQNGTLLYDTPVTTGMPQLPTPDGTYHVQWKETDVTFYSPWPPGSPYYYPPEFINYAMYFADNGYFIHDAPWRPKFGPGTNYPHTDPDGQVRTGSHGCVEVPTPAGAWLYNWAWDGATVVIYGTAPVPPSTPTPTATVTAQPTASPPTPTPTSNPPTATPTPTATP